MADGCTRRVSAVRPAERRGRTFGAPGLAGRGRVVGPKGPGLSCALATPA
jgi:hypothetical protein